MSQRFELNSTSVFSNCAKSFTPSSVNFQIWLHCARNRRGRKEGASCCYCSYSHVIIFSFFLDAFSHLYKRVCLSVLPSVRLSVRPSHTSWISVVVLLLPSIFLLLHSFSPSFSSSPPFSSSSSSLFLLFFISVILLSSYSIAVSWQALELPSPLGVSN